MLGCLLLKPVIDVLKIKFGKGALNSVRITAQVANPECEALELLIIFNILLRIELLLIVL